MGEDIGGACRRLAHSFCLLSDRADIEGVARLFTPDGVFERGDTRCEGQAAVATMMAARKPDMVTRHLMTTSVVTPLSDAEAEGCHYCLVFVDGAGFDPSRPIVREYRDRYSLTDQGWRIQSRRVLTPFPL